MNKFQFIYSLSVVLILLGVFRFCNGVPAYPEGKILTEEETSGVPSEIKNIASLDEDITRSKTAKRGLLLGGNKRQFGIDGLSALSGHGGYDSGRYGPLNTGFAVSGVGHYGNDQRPHYYDHDIGYHHSGGGYIGRRPSGPSYGPSHNYPVDYEDHYPGQSGVDQGGFKMSAIKKILLPLAGLAILGVAAAASQNPVLLPLGTLNGRRKRSLLPVDVYPPNPLVRR